MVIVGVIVIRVGVIRVSGVHVGGFICCCIETTMMSSLRFVNRSIFGRDYCLCLLLHCCGACVAAGAAAGVAADLFCLGRLPTH